MSPSTTQKIIFYMQNIQKRLASPMDCYFTPYYQTNLKGLNIPVL